MLSPFLRSSFWRHHSSVGHGAPRPTCRREPSAGRGLVRGRLPAGPRASPHRALRLHVVKMLRAHIEEFGTTKDGRLFGNERGGTVAATTYWRVWDEARHMALTPEQVASPPAARPYDLRYAALSSWLSADEDPPRLRSARATASKRARAGTPSASTAYRTTPIAGSPNSSETTATRRTGTATGQEPRAWKSAPQSLRRTAALFNTQMIQPTGPERTSRPSSRELWEPPGG